MPFLTSKNPNRKLLVSYKVKFSYVDKVKFSYVYPGFRMDTSLGGQQEWHQSPYCEAVLSFSATTRSSGRPRSHIAIPPPRPSPTSIRKKPSLGILSQNVPRNPAK